MGYRKAFFPQPPIYVELFAGILCRIAIQLPCESLTRDEVLSKVLINELKKFVVHGRCLFFIAGPNRPAAQ